MYRSDWRVGVLSAVLVAAAAGLAGLRHLIANRKDRRMDNEPNEAEVSVEQFADPVRLAALDLAIKHAGLLPESSQCASNVVNTAGQFLAFLEGR